MPTRALQGSAQALQRSISFAMLVAASTSSPSSSAPVAAAAGPLARRASTRPARACATPARRPPARCLPTPPCPPTPRLEATCNPQPTAPCRLSFLTGVVLVVGGHTELHRRLGEPAARKVQDALQLLQGRKRRQQLATLVGSSRRQANQAWVKGTAAAKLGGTCRAARDQGLRWPGPGANGAHAACSSAPGVTWGSAPLPLPRLVVEKVIERPHGALLSKRVRLHVALVAAQGAQEQAVDGGRA